MSDIAVEALDTQTALEAPSRAAIALVTLALAVGSFGIGTGEFVIMGLLPNVADTFGVTTPEAGHVISAYALGVVVGAPIIAVLAAKMARRTLLLLMMAIFAAGNISSAFAPTFESFTALRFITGLPHGAYFGVAALVAASMVPVHRRVRAVVAQQGGDIGGCSRWRHGRAGGQRGKQGDTGDAQRLHALAPNGFVVRISWRTSWQAPMVW